MRDAHVMLQWPGWVIETVESVLFSVWDPHLVQSHEVFPSIYLLKSFAQSFLSDITELIFLLPADMGWQ